MGSDAPSRPGPTDGPGGEPERGADPSAARVVRNRHGRRRSRTLRVFAVVCLGAAAVLGAIGWAIGSADASDPGDGDAPSPSTPATPLLSARRVPGFTTARVPVRAMEQAVAPVASAAPAQSCIVVGDGSAALYAHQGDTPVVPASNQKLLTAAAALELLGSDTRLATRFLAGGPLRDGVLQGDLYMVGGGDPLLTTEAYQERQRNGRFPATDLEAVADQLVADGLRGVTGSVVGDGTRYDGQRSLPEWPRRWLTGGTVAPLSGLLVNDAWLIDPVTGEGDGGAAADPDLHAATVMQRLLSDRGVTIGGPPRSGGAPDGAEELLVVDSLPVSELVGELLAFSDNTTGELLLKEIGLEASGEGSTTAGVAAVQGWAKRSGLDSEGWVMVDGSGLSSANRVSCSMLAELLRRDGPDGVLASSLAVPGQPGTLEERLDRGDMSSRLRAKTGTLNDVAALSGWFRTVEDAQLDFEFIMNTGSRSVSSEDLELQTELVAALLTQPVEVPLEQAGPLGGGRDDDGG